MGLPTMIATAVPAVAAAAPRRGAKAVLALHGVLSTQLFALWTVDVCEREAEF